MTNQAKSNVVNLFKKSEPLENWDIVKSKMYPLDPQQVIKQTPLAICMIADISHYTKPEEWQYIKDCWFPRSQMMGLFVPGWLLIAKAKEAAFGMVGLEKFIEASTKNLVSLSDFYMKLGDICINLDADFLKNNKN